MFKEGNIIYFDPFYFKNGNPAKAKYFVVLKNNGDNSILASLPTRTDSIPEKDVIKNGCVELPDINFNCFVISDDIEITDCGRYFDFPTYIYGYQLDTYEESLLREIYPNEGTDYEIWGKMKDGVFKELIECLKSSKSVRIKYLKILNN